jgi:ribosomal protein S18 acetylase RimI-like enzyme
VSGLGGTRADAGAVVVLRRGPDAAIVAAAEERARAAGARTVEIGVDKDEVSTLRLYERLGYRIVRSHLIAWTGHRIYDRWILVKEL